jgi:transposase
MHRQRRCGVLEERVRRAGPEHFGILAVDSAKHRFAVLLADFYGRVLMDVLEVDNTSFALEALVAEVKAQAERHGLKDLVAAIEQTGRYHVPIRQVLRKHWDVQMVHPYATKQLRQPADPGNKTDPTDLEAIVRALAVGYGRSEAELPARWADWRLVSREREALVRQRARARVRIEMRIEALTPGFSSLFGSLWDSPLPLLLARDYGSAPALLRDQIELLRPLEARIGQYERSLVDYLVDTPMVLLLSIPGINVVSTASYGAELGPIEHYLHPSKITGRAGIYPTRYQSDETDLADGPLVGQHNARLRDAIFEIAHNLLTHNDHFQAWAKLRENRKWSKKKIHVAVASKFVRISYWMVAVRTVFQHPCLGGRDAILRKLFRFAKSHGIPAQDTLSLLLRAGQQLPGGVREEEARALLAGLPKGPRRRPRSGPEPLGAILPRVIAWLAGGPSPETERSQPGQPQSAEDPVRSDLDR